MAKGLRRRQIYGRLDGSDCLGVGCRYVRDESSQIGGPPLCICLGRPVGELAGDVLKPRLHLLYGVSGRYGSLLQVVEVGGVPLYPCVEEGNPLLRRLEGGFFLS